VASDFADFLIDHGITSFQKMCPYYSIAPEKNPVGFLLHPYKKLCRNASGTVF
jgi:hypothetical protein